MDRAVRRMRAPGSVSPEANAGFTLIEVAVAILILMVGITSVVGALGLGIGVNKAEGELASRATTYAQDKLEELMLLDFGDTATDTSVFPAATSGGTGLAAGGSIVEGSATAGYVDYLTEEGVRTTTVADAFFTRQWSIADDASGNRKTLTVAVYTREVTNFSPPSTFVVGFKVNN